MKVRCSTLFDITKTGVSNRRGSLDSIDELQKERKQQSNFETVLQIISLRCQPEDISDPTVELDDTHWRNIKCWSFSFAVPGGQIFSDGGDRFAHLMDDCNGVPMFTGLDEDHIEQSTLSTTEPHKNIMFRIDDE